jgi:hypothetical protein
MACAKEECMADPIIYDVTPHGDGWLLGRRGNGEKSVNFDTREAAIDEAELRARRHDEARLVIRDRDGRIQEERKIGGRPTRENLG